MDMDKRTVGMILAAVAVLGGVAFGTFKKDDTKTRTGGILHNGAITAMPSASALAMEMRNPLDAFGVPKNLAGKKGKKKKGGGGPEDLEMPGGDGESDESETESALEKAAKEKALKERPLSPQDVSNKSAGVAKVAAAAVKVEPPPLPTYGRSIYKYLDENGRITYSERYPTHPKAKLLSEPGGAQAGDANEVANLPAEVRAVATRFPVILYVSNGCNACNAARALLRSRGVPFGERTVNTPQDAQALQSLSGDTSLPLLTIGQQQLKGFSDAEYTQYLDAADYPKTSVLPPNYNFQPAVAMVQSSDSAALARSTSVGLSNVSTGTSITGANGEQLVLEGASSRRGVESEGARQERTARQAEAAARAANPTGIRF